MSIKEAFINRKKELAAKFHELSEKIAVSKETYEERITMCRGCDNFIRHTQQCKECGCFMNAKARLSAASCPIKKW